jgi:2,4-didehydro-3-deoxy-L-rhamnonate hydrolase
MRLCRYESPNGDPAIGFYEDDHVLPLADVARAARGGSITSRTELLDCLPPDGPAFTEARRLSDWLATQSTEHRESLRLPLDRLQLLVPIPRPNKLLLLAGNYAKHIEEGGGVAAERAETFPYVFMKPPSTTLTHPGRPVTLPAVSPEHVDWELELGVVVGRRCKGVSEADALQYVAGYTVVNDLSDRQFRPNPARQPREKDAFFDWLHGKWHDGFCPLGPCVVTADAIPDPQSLAMTLTVNGEVQQQGSTSQMVFPVAAILEFVSRFVTLEPGDVISTGTPHGVGHAKGKWLRDGDLIEAQIESIGRLVTPIVAT